MKNLQDGFELKNGVKIPCIGLGTWQARGKDCYNATLNALRAGYRHIDTASAYGNEREVGLAIRDSGVPREEIFVTSKLWIDMRGYDNALCGFEKSLEELGLEYLDLYLIHWPASPSKYEDWVRINLSTWGGLCALYKEGRVRAIGVSNFLEHHLAPLLYSEIMPMVNQIEFHAGYMQSDIVSLCHKNGIVVEAWSPLGEGAMLKSPALAEIASKYGVSVAQLCVRWCLQNRTLPLPKSVNSDRIIENSRVFDFTIAPEDMARINAMEYFGGSGVHPDDFE